MDAGHYVTACTSVTHRSTLDVLIDLRLESLGFKFRGTLLLFIKTSRCYCRQQQQVVAGLLRCHLNVIRLLRQRPCKARSHSRKNHV